MITLFIQNAKPLQYALLRYDSKVYNFTSQGWDALPSNGVPAAANLQAMTAAATTGPLVTQQIAQVPDVISAGGGVAFLTFMTDAGGSLTLVDCVSVVDLIESGLRGGVSR